MLHPIVVDDGLPLVAGERRLHAWASLGWESIQATDLGSLTDTERAEIELKENLKRKNLTPYERAAREFRRWSDATAAVDDRGWPTVLAGDRGRLFARW